MRTINCANRLKSYLISVFAAAIIIFASQTTVSAQTYRVGDKVLASVSGLEGDQYYEACTMLEILGNGYRIKCSGIEYVVQKGWVKSFKETVKPEQRQADDRTVTTDDDDKTQDNEDKETAECNFEPPGAKVSNNDKFSAAVAKRKLYDNYKIGTTGGVSAPLKIGVAFMSLQIGKSFTNTARGGYRINDAAPVNATIYRIKSKHIVCEQYRDRTLRRRVESNYACFKNKDGEWVCGIDGVPKITQLQ